MTKKMKALEMKMAGKKAKIYFSGDVISDLSGEYCKEWAIENGYITPVDVRNALKDVEEDVEVEFHINSNGGEVAAGLAIANFLAQSKNKITCFVDGWAASIATVIALSCDSVKMPKNTYMMIHYPSSTICGNLKEMKKAVEDMEKITDSMIDFYASKSTVNREEIVELLENETWLTANEAEKLFNNVEVVENADLKAVAKIKPDLFDKIPTELLEILNDKVDKERERKQKLAQIDSAILDSIVEE